MKLYNIYWDTRYITKKLILHTTKSLFKDTNTQIKEHGESLSNNYPRTVKDSGSIHKFERILGYYTKNKD